MADIVNLNRFRKEKARNAKKSQADENAVKFGRSKADKQRDDAAHEKDVLHLDQHRLDPKDE
ncbi:DUF4169 family protein [Epibacterium sp. SM1969]|uniref:DUF4169 family protein n=1 Tax=Tritonibacter aquimaris TaxID=2663379 RepID=A0A844APF9_9RHOB|nr:DUF4169 family protein [Tritonibacter aquimaris]MQY41307.1 DUF4169 family protein [Tritonibacter aquimaris]